MKAISLSQAFLSSMETTTTGVCSWRIFSDQKNIGVSSSQACCWSGDDGCTNEDVGRAEAERLKGEKLSLSVNRQVHLEDYSLEGHIQATVGSNEKKVSRECESLTCSTPSTSQRF